jgi:colicin import membrane protein
MKRIVLALLALMPLLLMAQDNTWEQPKAGTNPDQKYLKGAVPEVDGRVTFKTTIKAPGKTKEQIYNIVLAELTRMTKEPGQFEQSRIVLADTLGHSQVVGTYQEWLVFKSTALVLDRTRLFYNLIASVSDGELELTMTRIYYLYDEERTPTTYQAEEWITDRYGLTKKMNKLARVSGKFRRKTIDRKDYLFMRFGELLGK